MCSPPQVLLPPTADCTMYLLAKDGVYLPKVPRLLQSSNPAGTLFNNVVVGPGMRCVGRHRSAGLLWAVALAAKAA